MKTNLLIYLLFLGVCFTSYSQINHHNTSKEGKAAYVKNAENSPTDGRISLRLAGNGSFVTILLGFIPEGTVDYDDGYDGPFINDGAAIEFYSFLGTTRLSIQALPELTNVNVQVPLGCELTSDGSYTISIDAEFLSPDFDIILEDRDQNVFTDLRQTAYTFSGVTGELHDRFFLNLDYHNTLDIIDVEDASDKVYAYFSSDRLKLYSQRNDIKTVKMFNSIGKQIFSSHFTNEILLKNIASGIYILQYTTTVGAKITKKIVK
ncbi:T9SS type A sorting domain-containing protein [uncultured Kordia sp.]|uniref:T9SS type A sorting domain-containing protein n=1 Tax=uncultured Kordia sp. TaxID=507699 RepID=UPI0026235631|nr:T9SS type A sorting domain-containing protein [uncultured Kordia sp.]